MHHSSLIRPFSSRVLHIVKALAVRLPDVDLHTFYWLAAGVFYGAEYETWFAFGIVGDLRAVRLALSFVGVEGSENCAFCAGWWFGVVDAVD
jgi:hypothetical protein